MPHYVTVLVILAFLSWVQCSKELIFSTVLFRHGERQRYNPSHPKAKCYKHLTNQGMRQLYVSGRYFRSKYIKQLGFLPYILDPPTVYFRATYLSRAMNSALSFYSGLYGPDVFQSDPTQFHKIKLPFDTSFDTKSTFSQYWVPHAPTVHTMYKDNDRLLYSYKKFVCPSLAPLKNDRWMSDRAKDLAEEGMLGEEAKKHPYALVANTPELVKLTAHNFLIQVVNYLHLALVRKGYDVGRSEQEIIEEIKYRDPAYKSHHKWREENPSAPELKLVVYGSHDTMVVSVVNALGVKLDKRVSVASTISIELLIDEKTGEPLVDVQLNRKRLKIPTCEGLCTLHEFEEAVERYGTFESDEEYMDKCLHMSFDNNNNS